MAASPAITKTDRELEDKMLAFAGDDERVEVLGRARTFKRSWIELAEALSAVVAKGSWQRWGFASFDAYCKKELHISPTTAAKLLGSFRFLETSAPVVIERAHREPAAPVPDLKVVDFVARAEERGAADESTLAEIRRAAFEEGAEAPMLSRRYKSVAFPVSDAEKESRARAQLASTARRLAHLLAEADGAVPHDIAAAAEEAIGRLLDAIDAPN